ncbi:hypothetical protein LLH23_13770 [bacterium]|nr:hypothetical protein [bacterium]
MRLRMGGALLLAALLQTTLSAATVTVSSQPAAAEVMWSLDHDPLVHLGGPAPAQLDVPAGRELTVCAQADGYWPAWRRTPVSGDGSLQMVLRPFSPDLSDVAVFGDDCALGSLTAREPQWRVASTWAAYQHNVRWSPDGRAVVWSRVSEWHGDPSGDLISSLTLINPVTRASRRLAWSLWKGLGNHYRYDVCWSCDGEYLLVSRPPNMMNGRESIDLVEIGTRLRRQLIADENLSCYFGTATGADRIGFVTGGFDRPWAMWACDWQGRGRVRLGACDHIAPCGTVDGRLVWAYRDKVYGYDGTAPRVLLTLPSARRTVQSLSAEPMGRRVLIVTVDRETETGWQAHIWSPESDVVRLQGNGDRAQWVTAGRILDSARGAVDAGSLLSQPRRPGSYWRSGVPGPAPSPLFE